MFCVSLISNFSIIYYTCKIFFLNGEAENRSRVSKKPILHLMKQTMMRLAIVVIALPGLLSSCATILSKSSYPVHISTEPSGATVSVTDKHNKEVFKGQSPADVTLKSGAGFFAKAEYQVKLTAPGYAEQVVPINFKINGWYFGNLLIGGVIGMLIVDPATGAMWKLDTPPLKVSLERTNAAAQVPTLQIIDIATLPQSAKEKLVRIK
jgi:hypothetical protein